MKLYVAGPMTGYPRWNFDSFEAAAVALRAKGYEVVSPHETDLGLGFDPDAPAHEFTAADYREALRRDVEHVFEVGGVALLPGWEDSKGARAENALGLALGLTVQSWTKWLALEPIEPEPIVPPTPDPEPTPEPDEITPTPDAPEEAE